MILFTLLVLYLLIGVASVLTLVHEACGGVRPFGDQLQDDLDEIGFWMSIPLWPLMWCYILYHEIEALLEGYSDLPKRFQDLARAMIYLYLDLL